MPKRDLILPTPDEDATINAGIAIDPDAREWSADDFRRAVPAGEAIPKLVAEYKRFRGQQKKPTKEQISVRLDADVLAQLRSTGPGWQTRMSDIIRRGLTR